MNCKLIFSVIIPHRNNIQYLPRLFNSIPDRDDLEIILVDNSESPITKEQIGVERSYKLIYSEPFRGAGGARNEGMKVARGEWLLFADADDFYTENAFDLFSSMANSSEDIIYTGMGGIYEDTGEPSDRGDEYTQMVKGYLRGDVSEMFLRLRFSSPCCKMVKNDLIKRNNIRYDEVVASNDMYFSMLSGFYAKSIKAVDCVTYIATVNRGSLTQRRSFNIIKSRLEVALRYNKFLREQNLGNYQHSVMYYLYQSKGYSVKEFATMIGMIIKYRQNPFIGCANWFRSLKMTINKDKKERKYIS